MRELSTPYGQVTIASEAEIFQQCAAYILQAAATSSALHVPVGLTGGSTPQAFYRWVAQEKPFSPEALQRLVWMTSDERFVPLESDQSNFGNASRLMLDPLGIPQDNRYPWPTHVDPHSASIVFNRQWNERFRPGNGFALAFFGMGDDGHTASIFPGSPIIGIGTPDNFICIDVPGKGWRLSITPTGISRSQQLIVVVMGANKAPMLQQVLQGDGAEADYPAKIFQHHAPRTHWLIDDAAASELSLS